MAEELVTEPAVLRSLRCFIVLRHYEDADAAAVAALLASLREEYRAVY